MSKRRQNLTKATGGKTPFAESPVAESTVVDYSRHWLLAGTTALFVATPMLPSEGATSGYSVTLQMGWLLLLVAWAVTGLLRRNLRVRIGIADIAMIVFVVLHTVSALVLLDKGQPRQTLNMLWQWVALGTAFFMFRQLIRCSQERRAMFAVGIALAVCLSMHGYHQYFVSLPQARQQFEQDPAGKLAEMGIQPGTVDAIQFKSRLDSTEPIATFSLANSLAGLLATWLVCAVGASALSWPNAESKQRMATAGLTSTLLIAGCFILTKSRTATLAVAIGLTILVVYGRRSGWRPSWIVVTSVIGGVTGLVVLGVVVGALDVQVVTESSKSLLYRMQYWHSSLALIADSPWFGCGPGNFQQAYMAYKLPEASETIADPHNWFFEIWATAGTFAMLAFVAVFIGAIVQLSRPLSKPTVKRSGLIDEGPDVESINGVRWIYWGALAGVPLGFFAGIIIGYLPDVVVLGVGLPVAAASVWAWHTWVMRGELPIVVIVAANVTVMVNFSAAGGISFAGVSLTLWLLLAIGLNQVEPKRDARHLTRSMTIGISISSAVVLIAFWYSTFNPVLTVSAMLARVSDLHGTERARDTESALLAATAADSFGVDPWMRLAELRLMKWLEGENPTTADRIAANEFAVAARAVLDRHKLSSPIHTAYGNWYLRAYRVTNEREYLDEAISAYQRAVELYPNHNLGHAQLAWTLHVARDRAGAAQSAAEALRLDALNPHSELALANQSVFDAEPRDDSQPLNPPNVNIEQLMQLLRRAEGSPTGGS